MKKILSLLLTVLLLLSCFAGMTFTVSAAEDISGVQTVSFAKNGVGSSPYMSGLNNPVGYCFKLDGEKRLLSISIPEFATYSNNTNKGTFKLYEWKGDRSATVAAAPIAERAIVNHVDHDTLTLEIPADLKVTGHLYFEVICLEGSSYTPWNADGGQIDPIPGVVTDLQAYLGGSPATPFACEITVCDMENKSASAYVTFTYDFSKGLSDQEDYNQVNQIKIENKQGYVTFTAEGDDPYFRFVDNYQPTPKTSDLAYAVIEYRTTASVGAGEFFTNRRSGAHWGDANAYVTWNYNTDGEWHTVVVDASNVWGNDETDELYAFRFDPLASGARAGDSIDIASIKFFGDGLYARSYAATREASIKEDESLAIAEGSAILDFALGAPAANMTVGDTVTAYGENDLTRFVSEAGGTVTLDTAIDAAFRHVKLVYRSEEAAGPITVTAHCGSESAAVTATPVFDGFWQEIILELPLPETLSEGTLLDKVTMDCPAGWVDIAYLGFFEKATYAEKYVYSRELNTHQFVLGSSDIPVYNVTDPTLGSPFCSGGQSYGQKFVAASPVRGIIVPGHATWGADASNNSGYFKLFAWNTDYATTVSGTPLVERELNDLKDGEDLVITFDELPAGDYCFEVKMTTPGDKAYTGFSSASGTATAGTVSFRNGQVNSDQLVAGYLTAGMGLQDVGNEYGTEVTFEYDFTRHYDSVTESLGLNDLSGVTVTDLCDKGYLSIKALQNDPFFAFGVDPTVTSNLMDHIVIKYRTESTAKSGEIFVNRTDGVTWGQPYAKSNVIWDWTADGEWHIAIIDASDTWGNVYDIMLQNLRFDPLEKPTGAGETIDVAYIKFFANAKAAEDFAATEYVVEGDTVTVKPPLMPLDPTTVSPVILLEGEAMSVEGGNQMQNAAYDFSKGSVTLTATGSDPGYFLYRESTEIAPFMAIRYRTTTRNVKGEIFAGSVQGSPNGRSDHLQFDYTSDGQWHTAIIDLTKIADYNAATNKVNYLRFDFLHSDSGLGGSAYLEVEYIGFFNTVDEATVYQHTLPAERNIHTATFTVNGVKVYTVEFRAGDASLEEPVVPILPGMVGVWEPYTLGDADITVNAVYTPAQEVTVPDMPEEITPPVGGDSTHDPSADTEPAADMDTSAPDTESEPAETRGTDGKGCSSVLGLTLLPLLLAVACTAFRKREDRA